MSVIDSSASHIAMQVEPAGTRPTKSSIVMAWLFRLPRVVAVPLALALVALAGCALAVLACSLPLILAYLWTRRSVADWQARRLLSRLYSMQRVHSLVMPEGAPRYYTQPAAAVGELAMQPGVCPPPEASGSLPHEV